MKNSMLSWFITLLVPMVLIGLAIRVLLTPLFYQFEYNMPYFPPDEYGFTKADRLKWAPYAINYLINNEGISYLGDLKFDDGSPLYNERELRHMQDVKSVTLGALRLWDISLMLLLGLGLWAWFGGWWQYFLLGLKRGGWLMVGLAALIGAIVIVGIAINPNVFDEFFVLFHSLFFEGNSWLFYFSDTLIRLFPIRFWEDAFLWAAVIALGGGLALGLGIKPRIG
jgi:integral membrane protein (TIGR01906 family)